ncbi:MAG TPA: hypothetical protein VJQ55_02445 [Candidatus Binatia bacterium]|nr:hypothetical protein [Candidatus Binatia bacterium]
MKANYKLWLCIYFSSMMLFSQPVFSEPTTQVESIPTIAKRLLELNRQIRTIGGDLLLLEKGLGDEGSARGFLLSLMFSSEKISANVLHAADILLLYHGMTSPMDRERLKKNLLGSLAERVEFLEVEIELANEAIADANHPEIASSASALRTITRQIIETLKALDL